MATIAALTLSPSVVCGRPAGRRSVAPRSSGRPSLLLAPRAAAEGTQTEAKPDPFATKEVYSDADPLSKFMIYYFSKVMSDQLNGHPFDGTYDAFVDLSREIMRGRWLATSCPTGRS